MFVMNSRRLTGSKWNNTTVFIPSLWTSCNMFIVHNKVCEVFFKMLHFIS